MKKIIVTALVGSLIAGALAAPATAKKKKPKTPTGVASELKYYLHWDDDGAGGCGGAQHMSTEDKEDPGSGCEFTFLPAQEVFVASGAQAPLSREWPASDAVPFVLDATRKITGEITMRGGAGVQARIEVVVTGVVNGEVVEVAKGETQRVNFAVTGQTGPQILKFELTPDAALNGKTFEGLTLKTTTRGFTAASYYDLENPPSFMTVPTTKF